MNIIRLLVGVRFLSLIIEGKKTDRLIKANKATSLKCSSSELNGFYTNEWNRCFCPNPISIGILCFLFVILYIGGSGMILDFCNLPTKMSAVASLSLITVISIIISAIPYTLGRGHINGLSIMLSLYFLDISLTLIGIFLMVIKSIELDTLQMQLILFPVQLLLIYFCHYLMNSEMFSRAVLFFRTKRLVLEINKMRQK
ncbi:hypothetical protein RN38_07120 [Hafnia paralvei]|jgi:hypothetical protein|uniref:Uncharacterized protein n=2 Tax=Hafnia paralvei TaxID=546367 RepID=A0A2A2MEW3_9GAMM|nr:hypothetical protein RN38_07120 [Hafnia paralvei]PAV97295.1 hypothetical protein CJD50_06455 [Hafnia paralvei]